MNDLNQQHHDLLPTTECHYYNETSCRTSGHDCNGTRLCKTGDAPDKPPTCYVLWHKNADGEFTVNLKGCWVGHVGDCRDHDRCVERRKDPKKNMYFCCCHGNNCNRDMEHSPEEEIEKQGTLF